MRFVRAMKSISNAWNVERKRSKRNSKKLHRLRTHKDPSFPAPLIWNISLQTLRRQVNWLVHLSAVQPYRNLLTSSSCFPSSRLGLSRITEKLARLRLLREANIARSSIFSRASRMQSLRTQSSGSGLKPKGSGWAEGITNSTTTTERFFTFPPKLVSFLSVTFKSILSCGFNYFYYYYLLLICLLYIQFKSDSFEFYVYLVIILFRFQQHNILKRDVFI